MTAWTILAILAAGAATAPHLNAQLLTLENRELVSISGESLSLGGISTKQVGMELHVHDLWKRSPLKLASQVPSNSTCAEASGLGSLMQPNMQSPMAFIIGAQKSGENSEPPIMFQ